MAQSPIHLAGSAKQARRTDAENAAMRGQKFHCSLCHLSGNLLQLVGEVTT